MDKGGRGIAPGLQRGCLRGRTPPRCGIRTTRHQPGGRHAELQPSAPILCRRRSTRQIHVRARLERQRQNRLRTRSARRARRLSRRGQALSQNLVVGCECMFAWYWLADLCEDKRIPFVLGHALAMKHIHGGKAKSDKIDAGKLANMLRGGMFPLAYVWGAARLTGRSRRPRPSRLACGASTPRCLAAAQVRPRSLGLAPRPVTEEPDIEPEGVRPRLHPTSIGQRAKRLLRPDDRVKTN